MLHVYRQLANSVGTNDATELALDLMGWHDDMVRHARASTSPSDARRSCAEMEDCPHVQAQELWHRSQQIFGRDADVLTFLATSAAIR